MKNKFVAFDYISGENLMTNVVHNPHSIGNFWNALTSLLYSALPHFFIAFIFMQYVMPLIDKSLFTTEWANNLSRLKDNSSSC